ncbi:12211_t:CDS:10 [Ambispora leptoticha]|uniref:12211_t:CDS:1 n=1 Tax=Ambispora leptoticha TaxID=144679 RepID=A0A9N8ZL28_9GLOM|nr:12211_t:CDS:10 [Ambispora leptoticha]
MLSNIKEPGPGFEYFLNTSCQDWDAFVTFSSHPLLSPPYFVANTTATHGTSSSHGYGLRLRYWLQLPMELRLRMVMDFTSAVTESMKTGLIDNFWLKYNNDINFTKHEKMKVNSTFLSCDGVQIGCIGNNIQAKCKRDYKIHEQPSVEEETSAIPTKMRKLDEKFNATKSSSELLLSMNVKQTSTISEPDDKSTEELGDDEEIKFDLARISMELQREPRTKWEVGCINVTDRFRWYQKEVIQKAERGGLKYANIYEVLALSSIMVLCWPCSYPMFTNREWKEITNTNPYVINEPPLSPEISSSLHNATRIHLVNNDIFMNGGNSDLSRAVTSKCVPKVAPLKLSEEEHCYMFLYPISRPLFTGSEKEYELRLNRANKGTKKDQIFPARKDSLKVQLNARESINLQLETKGGPGEAGIFLNMGDLMESFFMDLQYDGLYRSWPFLTTRLVIDKTTIPLAESAIGHLVALEERIEKIAENYKYRSSQFTPPAQMSFVRKLPDSPQVKLLLH